MPEMERPLLEMKGISKAYPGVKALDNVDFTLHRGEVHALVGENGAGKSTLIKIIMGIEQRDSGVVRVNGAPVSFKSSLDAQKQGIAAVFQELSQVPYLTVAENVYLGREKQTGAGVLHRSVMYRRAQQIVDEYGMELDVRAMVSGLSMAGRQIAEITKAIAMEPELLILDEPTSSLTENEAENLFRIIHAFREKGIGVIYISHRMNELEKLADRVTVLRDGKNVDTKPLAETSLDEVVEMMVGRETNLYQRTGQRITDYTGRKRVLEVRGLSQKGRFADISFDLYEGEVLGVAGLMGAGRSELMRILFGVDSATGGSILVEGREVAIRGVRDAMNAGIAMVPESRQLQGLVLIHSIQDNLLLPQTRRFTNKIGFLRRKQVRAFGREMIGKYAIKTDSPHKIVRQLSGGNQQKVVLAKWLAANPKILIIDEPTVGVDIHSKTEIHRLIRGLANQGLGVIMVSSEMPELISHSDRVMILNDYRMLGIVDDPDQTEIMGRIMQDKANAKKEGALL